MSLKDWYAHLRSDRGQVVVTGLVDIDQPVYAPVEKIYVPLRVRHPALEPSQRGQRSKEPEPTDAAAWLAAAGVPADERRDPAAHAAYAERLGRLLAPGAQPNGADAARAAETLEVERVVERERLLVIEGLPGTGKSTALQTATMRCATEPHVPVLVPLRDFARWLANQSAARREVGDPALLANYVVERLRVHLHGDAEQAVVSPGLVVLLDGLDEVPDATNRADVVRAITGFARRNAQARLVVSSRPAGLDAAAVARLRTTGFVHVELQPLAAGEIHRFIHNWHSAIPRPAAEAARDADDLFHRVHDNPLAETPVLLMAMALVHHLRGELPDRETDLFEAVVQALCGRWKQATLSKEDATALAGPLSLDDKVQVLQRLAYDMHRHGRDGQQVERAELERALRDYAPPEKLADGDAVQAALDSLVHRSGLVVPDGECHYRFRHLKFQEFLAGRYVATAFDEPEDELPKLLGDPWWRQAGQHALCFPAIKSPNASRRILKALARTLPDLQPADARAEALGVVARAACALRRYADAHKLGDVAAGYAKAFVTTLDDTAQPGSVEAREACSHALGCFDDPRLGWENDDYMLLVPAGPFVMGGVDEDAYGDEKPVREAVYVTEFRVARFPITCAQFAAFVEAGGYDRADLWPFGGIPDSNRRPTPARLAETPSVPVGGRSWFEAFAFCRWLNQAHRRADGWAWRLPTEAEWEKAARGGAVLTGGAEPDPRRLYPWVGSWDRAKAAETARSVGCHAAGRGPYGADDQAGNVWEWCLDAFGPYREGGLEDPLAWPPANDARRKPRVLRGGGWDWVPRGLRVSCRVRFEPEDRDPVFGFRVVASPRLPLPFAP